MIGGLFKSASRLALVAAAGIIAGGVSAQAADLGGNCCADLEERVAELEATTARKGNRKVSLTVYGQVNKSLLWHDDELGYREGKVTVRDNDAGMSRFGFRGSAKIRPDLEAGYVIEVGLGNEDFGTNSDKTTEPGFGAFTLRHNYVYLNSQTFGRVNVGQTSQITDGLYEISLANTQVTPGGMDESEYMLHSHFATIFSNGFDGGRKQGVYYSTPTMAGFILAAGYSHDSQSLKTSVDAADYWEVALRYAGEFNGIRVAGGIGYRMKEGITANSDSDTILGSGSVMHMPTGLFLSGGYAKTDDDNNGNDKDGFWVMAGIEKNWFVPGTTTLFAEYSEVDFKNVAQNGTYYGAGVVQKFDAAAMDLYLNWRNYDANGVPGHNNVDANVVVGGAIIRF